MGVGSGGSEVGQENAGGEEAMFSLFGSSVSSVNSQTLLHGEAISNPR